MANALLGYANKIDDATLSGGSWSANAPLDNLKSAILSVPARSADATATNTQFDVDLGAATSIGMVALVATNLTLSATVRVRGAAVADFSVSLYDSGTINAFPAGITEAMLEGATRATFVVLSSHVSARYWRIEVSDTGNADGFVEIGRAFVGPYWQPSFNMTYGATLGWIDRDEVDETDSGTEYFSAKPSARVVTFDLNALPESEAMESAFELQRISSTSAEVVFMWNPADTSHRLRRSFLGRLRSRKAMNFAHYRRVNAAFEIKEIIGASSVGVSSGTPGSYAGANAGAYDVGCYIAGAAEASEVVMRFVAVRAFTLPAGLTGSQANAGTGADDDDIVFSVKKNGGEIGTIEWDSGDTDGAFSAASSTSFAVGDVLSIVAPASPDATLADISITLKGARA